MKMKYFRFLFCETRSCFMHFGELNDTHMEERFSFLYLKGTEGLVDQIEESEHTLFLCPQQVNLVVAARADVDTKGALQQLLERVAVDTLVVPEELLAEERELLPLISKKVANVIRLSAAEDDRSVCRILAAGWNFFLKCYEAGSVVMVHSVDGISENGFEDCVMSVKNMDAEKMCSRSDCPDGYGCALGCTLHQDYDVCRYRDAEGVTPTGIVMMSGERSTVSLDLVRKDWADQFGNPMDDFRFIGLPETVDDPLLEDELQQLPEARYKRYFVGTEKSVNDAAIAGICRGKWYHIPALIGQEQGICCAGLLKYKD